jgi:hypothetical protein
VICTAMEGGLWRLPWQELLSCQLLAIQAAAGVYVLRTPSSLNSGQHAGSSYLPIHFDSLVISLGRGGGGRSGQEHEMVHG